MTPQTESVSRRAELGVGCGGRAGVSGYLKNRTGSLRTVTHTTTADCKANWSVTIRKLFLKCSLFVNEAF